MIDHVPLISCSNKFLLSPHNRRASNRIFELFYPIQLLQKSELISFTLRAAKKQWLKTTDEPECASEISKILIPLSYANLTMASACSSGTLGENMGQVPNPTFETRKPLLPKFLYRKPGVGATP